MSQALLLKHLKNAIFLITGALIVTIGYLIFIQPNHLLAGGIWGICAIIQRFLPQIPFAIYLILFNIPLFILSLKELSLRFTSYTVFIMILESALLMLLENHLPVYTHDPLLASIFGGVLIGLGGGLIVTYHGSSGGLDIIGIVLKEKTDVSVGTVSLIGNVAVVMLAAIFFGFERGMYTMVSLYATSYVFTQILEGWQRKRNLMIVTENGKEVTKRLLNQLGRGVTMIKAEGGYSHREKAVLFCVVSRFELPDIKEIIREVDPNSFVWINETYEVMGRWFQSRKKITYMATNNIGKHPCAVFSLMTKKKMPNLNIK